MPDTGNAKDCQPQIFRFLHQKTWLDKLVWLVSQYSIVFYFFLFVKSLFHSSDFFKFELQCMFMVLRSIGPLYLRIKNGKIKTVQNNTYVWNWRETTHFLVEVIYSLQQLRKKLGRVVQIHVCCRLA